MFRAGPRRRDMKCVEPLGLSNRLYTNEKQVTFAGRREIMRHHIIFTVKSFSHYYSYVQTDWYGGGTVWYGMVPYHTIVVVAGTTSRQPLSLSSWFNLDQSSQALSRQRHWYRDDLFRALQLYGTYSQV